MGRKSQSSGGIEIRQNSIRLRFTNGEKRFVETLYLGDTPMPPTPANVKYAGRVAIEIRQKITAGVFEISDYFPHSTAAKPSDPAKSDLLHDVMDKWIRLYPGRASTKKIYAMRINTFWKKHLENIAIRKIKYSDILEALSKGTWKSGSRANPASQPEPDRGSMEGRLYRLAQAAEGRARNRRKVLCGLWPAHQQHAQERIFRVD